MSLIFLFLAIKGTPASCCLEQQQLHSLDHRFRQAGLPFNAQREFGLFYSFLEQSSFWHSVISQYFQIFFFFFFIVVFCFTNHVLLLLFSCQVVSSRFVTPPNCRLPGSSVHRVSQARILEWVAISLLYDLCLWILENISKM